MGGMRGTQGKPAEVAGDPQAAREMVIRAIFREQYKLLVALFAKDGPTMHARALSSSIMALKLRDKDGKLMLGGVSPEMIAEKCIACHHMGLEPVTEAYLVPYGSTLKIIKAPQGLIKLMANAGWRVVARAVREGDFFEHDLGDEGFIRHRKADGRRESPVTYGYAFAKHKDGGPTIRDVFSRDDIESRRAQSQQANGPMWNDNFEGAVRKTMIHAIAEYVPLPSEVRAVMRESADGGVDIPEEIMVAVRRRLVEDVRAEMGLTGPANEVVTLPANGAEPGREAGSDG